MAIADELVAVLAYDVRGADALKRYSQSIDTMQSKLMAFASVAGKVGALAAGALAGGFALLGKSSISASAQMEGYLTSMETIEGSAEKAKQSMDWIKEFAKKTPYELDGVTESFIKLKSYGIDPVANDTLKTLGDMASAMNKPLNQAVEAFADASTFEFERLKEFGIKAKQEGDNVTFGWTENNKEMSKTVKKTATDVRKFLLEVAGRRFGGAMDKQSKTFNGMMSNLKDNWSEFQRMIGEKGFFEVVKNQLGGWLDQINRLDKEGKLDRWAQGISDALSKVAGFFATIAQRTAVNIEFLLDNFEKLKTPLMIIGALLAALIAYAMPMVTAFVALGLAVDDFLAYLQGGESYIGDFVNWLSKLDIVKQIAASFATLSAEFGKLSSAVSAAFTSGDWTNVGQMIAQAIIGGVKAVFAAGDWLTAQGAAWLGTITDGLINADWPGIGSRIVELVFRPWASFLLGFWPTLLEPLVSAFESVGGRLVAWFQSLGAQFVAAMANVGTQIGEALYNGIVSVSGKIQAWFASLIPDWAKGWFGGGSGGTPTPPALGNSAGADALRNLQGNVLKSTDGKAQTAAVSNDNRQDNRQMPFTVNTTVNQQVTQAANAPGQAAAATGAAVAGAVAAQRSQVEQGPAF